MVNSSEKGKGSYYYYLLCKRTKQKQISKETKESSKGKWGGEKWEGVYVGIRE